MWLFIPNFALRHPASWQVHERSSPRVDHPANWLTASWYVDEYSSYQQRSWDHRNLVATRQESIKLCICLKRDVHTKMCVKRRLLWNSPIGTNGHHQRWPRLTRQLTVLWAAKTKHANITSVSAFATNLIPHVWQSNVTINHSCSSYFAQQFHALITVVFTN